MTEAKVDTAALKGLAGAMRSVFWYQPEAQAMPPDQLPLAVAAAANLNANAAALQQHQKIAEAEGQRLSEMLDSAATAYDKLTASIGGTTLASWSNLDARPGYLQKSFDVSSFAGRTVTLSFTGTEDSGLQTSFVLDDIALDVSGGDGVPGRGIPQVGPARDRHGQPERLVVAAQVDGDPPRPGEAG